MQSLYRAIARVTKTHGKRGEVVAVPADGLPFLLQEGMRVAVVPPELKGDRFHTVESVEDGRGGQLVSLSGVGDIGTAEALVGKTVLVAREDLPEDFEIRDVASLIGREVVDDAFGDLGSIEEVMLGNANDAWSVVGPFGEVLIPVVDAFVEVESAAAEGPIRTHLPAGYISGIEGE